MGGAIPSTFVQAKPSGQGPVLVKVCWFCYSYGLVRLVSLKRPKASSTLLFRLSFRIPKSSLTSGLFDFLESCSDIVGIGVVKVVQDGHGLSPDLSGSVGQPHGQKHRNFSSTPCRDRPCCWRMDRSRAPNDVAYSDGMRTLPRRCR
jgi:hypothetical protein